MLLLDAHAVQDSEVSIGVPETITRATHDQFKTRSLTLPSQCLVSVVLVSMLYNYERAIDKFTGIIQPRVGALEYKMCGVDS